MASIRDYVMRDVVCLPPTATAQEAARVMTQRRIGSVGVLDGDRIVGLVTERDLVGLVLAHGCDSDEPIVDAMRADIPKVTARMQETEALRVMRDHYTRHLLVEDGGDVVGIVSMRDIIQLMLDEKQYAIDQLEAYIHG